MGSSPSSPTACASWSSNLQRSWFAADRLAFEPAQAALGLSNSETKALWRVCNALRMQALRDTGDLHAIKSGSLDRRNALGSQVTYADGVPVDLVDVRLGRVHVPRLTFITFMGLFTSSITDNAHRLLLRAGGGQFTFRGFVEWCFCMCAPLRTSLSQIAFDLYDFDGDGVLGHGDLTQLVRLYFGPTDGPVVSSSHRARTLLRYLAHEDGLADLDARCERVTFIDAVGRLPSLLYPAFEVQQAVQKAVLGKRFWEGQRVNRTRRFGDTAGLDAFKHKLTLLAFEQMVCDEKYASEDKLRLKPNEAPSLFSPVAVQFALPRPPSKPVAGSPVAVASPPHQPPPNRRSLAPPPPHHPSHTSVAVALPAPPAPPTTSRPHRRSSPPSRRPPPPSRPPPRPSRSPPPSRPPPSAPTHARSPDTVDRDHRGQHHKRRPQPQHHASHHHRSPHHRKHGGRRRPRQHRRRKHHSPPTTSKRRGESNRGSPGVELSPGLLVRSPVLQTITKRGPSPLRPSSVELIKTASPPPSPPSVGSTRLLGQPPARTGVLSRLKAKLVAPRTTHVSPIVTTTPPTPYTPSSARKIRPSSAKTRHRITPGGHSSRGSASARRPKSASSRSQGGGGTSRKARPASAPWKRPSSGRVRPSSAPSKRPSSGRVRPSSAVVRPGASGRRVVKDDGVLSSGVRKVWDPTLLPWEDPMNHMMRRAKSSHPTTQRHLLSTAP